MTKEDELLLATTEDKIEKCEDAYMLTNTDFLDMRQRTLAEGVCRSRKGLKYVFYGGYDEAERTIGIFLPDYVADGVASIVENENACMDAVRLDVVGRGVVGRDAARPDAVGRVTGSRDAASGCSLSGYFAENPDDNPLVLLRMKQTGGRTLSHRDYLGALTGLGVRREKAGDILVRSDGADIIILKEIAEFLLANYQKAGRASLEAEILSIDQLIVPENLFEEYKDTVASLRLDNVVASAFHLSRGKAADAISGGVVFVNGLQCEKPDKLVKQGDKLVLRGKGKALLLEVGGTTRKDRTYITIRRYI